MAAVFFVLAFTFVLEFVFAFAFGFTLVLFFDLVAGIFCSLISQHEILTAIVISAFLSCGVIFFSAQVRYQEPPMRGDPCQIGIRPGWGKNLKYLPVRDLQFFLFRHIICNRDKYREGDSLVWKGQ